MKNIFYSIFFFAITMASFLEEKTAFAQGYTGPKLASPTPAVGTLFDFLVKILEIVTRISIPVITLAFIWTGYLFVSSSGDDAKLKLAKGWLLGTATATAIIFGSIVIATLIKNTVGLIGG